MKRIAWLLGVTLAVGIGAGVIGTGVLTAQPEPVKLTVLLKTDLVGIEGKEAAVRLVEIAPGAEVGKHYHPGHVFAYVLEGSGIVEAEGQPPVTLKQGDVNYEPPRQVHTAKNASTTAPFKLLAWSIVEKGQPHAVPVK
jgi:quercetin dioxygenase-like cupin family protein